MPSTTITVHGGREISATSYGSSGAPFDITVYSDDGTWHETTFYTGDLALSRKLADAINATVKQHREELAEKAAA